MPAPKFVIPKPRKDANSATGELHVYHSIAFRASFNELQTAICFITNVLINLLVYFFVF